MKQLGRTITGRDSGSNKQTASKSCALSLIRQLFHLGVIEAFSGTLKKEKTGNEMKPFPVRISPQLHSQVKDCLVDLNITPNVIINRDDNQPVTLLSNQIFHELQEQKATAAGVVQWSPPQPNWNPWTGCNIDEGSLANASLDELSEQLLADAKRELDINDSLRKSIEERSQLPVHNMKGNIMNIMNEHPVIIIKGNTGCGKWEYRFGSFVYI